MLRIQPRNNIINPSFIANRHLHSNQLQNDTVKFSSNEKKDTNDSTAKNPVFTGNKGFASIIQCLKNLFETNNNGNIEDSTKCGNFEKSEELPGVVYSSIASEEEIEAEQEEIKRILEQVAENKKIRRMETEFEKEIKESEANLEPTFPEYTDDELKDIFNKFKNEDSIQRKSRFYSMIDNNYLGLRYSGNYKIAEAMNCDIKELYPSYYSSDEGVSVYLNDGWIWHHVEGCEHKAKDRVSLSVVADIDLLHKLDTLLLKGMYEVEEGLICVLRGNQHTKGFYKIGNTKNEWCRRQDPITMYFDEKVSTPMLDAIATVTKNYRRIPNKKLLGSIPGKPWMANEPYITKLQVGSLIDEANEVDKDLANAIREYLSEGASTGMYHSSKKVLDDYKHYKTTV